MSTKAWIIWIVVAALVGWFATAIADTASAAIERGKLATPAQIYGVRG